MNRMSYNMKKISFMINKTSQDLNGFAVSEYLNKYSTSFTNDIYEIEVEEEFFQNIIELIYLYKLDNDKKNIIFYDSQTNEEIISYILEEIKVK